MGAVTYPDPAVRDLLEEWFVAFQLNAHGPKDGAEARLLARNRLLWEPGFVVFDARGTEIGRTVGFRPPAELVGWLSIGLGKVALLEGRLTEAVAWLGRVADAEPTLDVSPEAQYWLGIAAFRAEGDLDGLRRRWGVIRDRWPGSGWWSRADVFGGGLSDTEPNHNRPREGS